MDASQPTSQPVAGPSLAARNRRDGWLMVAPAVLLLLGLGIYPLVRALTLSFQRWELQSPEQPWVGLANYGEAIRDARVWASLQHTLVIVVFAVTLELLLGFGLALLLSGDFPGKRVVLPAMMLPVMMVPVVVGLTWRTLWDNQYGPINAVIGRIIGHPPNIVWLANQKTALVAIVVTDVWQWTPFMLLILLAGLTGVNPELYEAAALDGAGLLAIMPSMLYCPGPTKKKSVATYRYISESSRAWNGSLAWRMNPATIIVPAISTVLIRVPKPSASISPPKNSEYPARVAKSSGAGNHISFTPWANLVMSPNTLL